MIDLYLSARLYSKGINLKFYFECLYYNIKIIKGRMQIKKCSLNFCQGEAGENQQEIQEKLSSECAKKIKSSKQDSIDIHQKDQHPKTVFSFQLKCSRSYENSDKNKTNTAHINAQHQPSTMKIQFCMSTQRSPSQQIQPKLPQYTRVRYFTSPPPRNAFALAPIPQRQIFKRPPTIEQNSNQQYNKPSINFQTKSNVCLGRGIDFTSKNSAETQNSSMSSQSESNKNKQNFLKDNVLLNVVELQPCAQPPKLLKRYSQKTSSPQFRSYNSFHPEVVYPSFSKLQHVQPKRIFEKTNTIKSILAISQMKEPSVVDSFIHIQQLKDSQFVYHDKENINNFKNFAKGKKKTAFFGFGNKLNETEKSIIHGLAQCMSREHISQQTVPERPYEQRKVHFLFESKISRNQIDFSESVEPKQEGRQPQPKHVQNKNIQPSLHNIVQSTQIQHKLSIENSIKEMPLITPEMIDDHNALRMRYINTIKSIGGESFKSENSYLDIKFMQNLNSRRAVVKLV